MLYISYELGNERCYLTHRYRFFSLDFLTFDTSGLIARMQDRFEAIEWLDPPSQRYPKKNRGILWRWPEGKPMVNSPLIRPQIPGGKRGIGGVPFGSHDYCNLLWNGRMWLPKSLLAEGWFEMVRLLGRNRLKNILRTSHLNKQPWICLRWFCTLYHSKSILNHHWGNMFYFFQAPYANSNNRAIVCSVFRSWGDCSKKPLTRHCIRHEKRTDRIRFTKVPFCKAFERQPGLFFFTLWIWRFKPSPFRKWTVNIC